MLALLVFTNELQSIWTKDWAAEPTQPKFEDSGAWLNILRVQVKLGLSLVNQPIFILDWVKWIIVIIPLLWF